MKLNLKGIRFNTWFYFFLFSTLILLLLGILQTSLIKPYFRNNRINTIEFITNELETNLLEKEVFSSSDVNSNFNLILNNNMCAIILNQNGDVVYEGDALGATCIFDKSTTIEEETYIPIRDTNRLISLIEEDNTYSSSITSSINGLEMIIYGKKIEADLANYYLFINSPVELVESYVQFFIDQYIYMAVAVFGIALLISLVLANRIASPIVKIKRGADRLRDGDYSVSFDENSFTEINDLSKTLNETSKQLEIVDELQKDLIANVSHDIKTPLTMIKAYSEMIRDISGDNKEKRNEHLEVIIEETDYLNRLVDDMREVSKMQAGQQVLHKTNFDVKELIEKIINHYDTLLNERGLKLETSLRTSVVWADETGIERVIANFLSNAIKYSFDDSTIIIKMIDSEEKLRVEVIDDGKGIAEEELPYIWSRYYKIDKGFSRNINSTGLGLAIASAILDAHRAKYGVTSKVNVGSTFWFEISKDYDEERNKTK